MNKKSKKTVAQKTKSVSLATDKKLLDDIRVLIDETRQQVAQTVNVALVLRNWQ